MSSIQANAKIFWLAFQSLSRKEKRKVIEEFMSQDDFREDLLDIFIFESRKQEHPHPIEEYLSKRK